MNENTSFTICVCAVCCLLAFWVHSCSVTQRACIEAKGGEHKFSCRWEGE